MPNSLEQIIACIKQNKSFILEAGAGSGKTWTLIESLKYILTESSTELEKQNRQVVCITYTNVAKNQIEERINYSSLVLVLTIHDFLWRVIKNYQKELKLLILDYNEKKAKNPISGLDKMLEKAFIEYTAYGRDFTQGRISHEEIIEFSSGLFKTYPKISKIVGDKFPYIFIDEFQDTDERTVSLLIEFLLKNNKSKLTLGFFGDAMQKIYGQGIGRIKSSELSVITKKENFRSSSKVVSLLNNIRSDLVQQNVNSGTAGEISYFNCNNCLSDSNNYDKVLEELRVKHGWDFDNTKILFLTHKVIADYLGYEALLAAYTDNFPSFGRERLFNQEDAFSDFLINKVERLFYFYNTKMYTEFTNLLGKEGFILQNKSYKDQIRILMETLETLRKNGTIKEVIDYVIENKLLIKSERMKDFEQDINELELDEKTLRDKIFYEALMPLKYQQIITFNQFIEEKTPFSTKHGTKGAEFDNVLVVIDDSAWNQYNFDAVFSQNKKNASIYNRSLNLLYVCCSRAKNNLALLSLSQVSALSFTTLSKWFGKENVYDVCLLEN